MRKILTLAFTLLSIGLFAQVNERVALKANIQSSSGAGPTFTFYAIVSDDLSRWSASDVVVGDRLYVLGGSDCVELVIDSIIVTAGSILQARATEVTSILGGLPSGQAGIVSPFPNRIVPFGISGLRADLASCISQRISAIIDTISGGGATNLSFTGLTDTITLNSSNGTDVDIIAGNNITLTNVGGSMVITADDFGFIDTTRQRIYLPAHGFTLPTKGYIPINSEFDLAKASSIDSIQVGYIVGVPHPDTIEFITGGVITVPGHGLSIGALYYLNDDGTEDTSDNGSVSSVTAFPLDSNSISLREIGAITERYSPFRPLPSPILTVYGTNPLNPSDSIVGVIVNNVYKPLGLATAGTIFTTPYAGASQNTRYQNTDPMNQSYNPSNAWIYDGRSTVVRLKEKLLGLNLEDTLFSLQSLTPITCYTDSCAIEWFNTNYANGIRLPNGFIGYVIGSGTVNHPEHIWFYTDNHNSLFNDGVIRISGDETWLKPELEAGNVTINNGTNTLVLTAPEMFDEQKPAIQFQHNTLGDPAYYRAFELTDSTDRYALQYHDNEYQVVSTLPNKIITPRLETVVDSLVLRINSSTGTAGQVPMASGNGGTFWQNLPATQTLTEGSGITIAGDSINWNGPVFQDVVLNFQENHSLDISGLTDFLLEIDGESGSAGQVLGYDTGSGGVVWKIPVSGGDGVELIGDSLNIGGTSNNDISIDMQGNNFSIFTAGNFEIYADNDAQFTFFEGDLSVAAQVLDIGVEPAGAQIYADAMQFNIYSAVPLSFTTEDSLSITISGDGGSAGDVLTATGTGTAIWQSPSTSGVQYSDSLTTFVTPTMLADTAAAIRGDFPTDTNTNLANTDLVNGSVYRTYTIPNTHTLDFIDQGGGNNFLARFSNRGFLTADKPTLLLQIRDSVSTNFSNLLLTPDSADLFANKLTLKMPPLDATPTRLLTIDPSTRQVKYVLKDSIGGSGGPANLAYTGTADVIELDAGGTPVFIAEGSGVDVTQSGDTLTIAASGGGGTWLKTELEAGNDVIISAIDYPALEIDNTRLILLQSNTESLDRSRIRLESEEEISTLAFSAVNDSTNNSVFFDAESTYEYGYFYFGAQFADTIISGIEGQSRVDESIITVYTDTLDLTNVGNIKGLPTTDLAYTGTANVIELDAGGTSVFIAEGSGVDVTQSGDTLRIAATADATGVKVDTVTFFYSGNTIEIFCAYDTLLRNIPIVAVMPGLRQSVSDFEASTLTRFAERGMFAVFINMRGRGNSTGNPDAGANEIKDIWQAVEQVKTTYRRRVDPEKVSIVGYSGGGGNVYSAITKFPYNFSTAISFFGIADYAAWHADGAGNAVLQDTLESWVGGTPASAPDRYEARNSLTAIGNYGGRLIALHDQGDLLVNISQTRNVGTEAAQFPRMEISIDTTISADAIRWHHSLPYDTSDLLFAEDYYFDELLTAQRLQMPESGSMKIQGYLYTPEFRVELGNGANAYGTVEYNTITDTYTITSSNFDLGYCFYLPTKGRDTISATVNDTLRTVVGTPVWTQVYCLDGFSPEDVDSLFYWFAADEAGTVLDSVGGSIADFEGVGEWQDLSGNNHDVAQSTEANRPQYRTNQVNGKPAIYFDGTNDFLISANHLWESDDITVFYVVQYENATRDAQEVVFGKYIANDSSRSWFVSGGNASHGYRHRWVGTNNGTSGTIWEYRSTAAKSASWQQITLRDNNTTREWWVDGVSSANINHNNIKTAIFDSSVAFSIGDAAAAPLLPFQGYIAEIIIYSRALDTTERENVQTYLIEKYGL